MQLNLTLLLAMAGLDLMALGLLLAVVWSEHQRQRRIAAERGEPIPPPAIPQLVALAAGGLLLSAIACVSLWLVLRE